MMIEAALFFWTCSKRFFASSARLVVWFCLIGWPAAGLAETRDLSYAAPIAFSDDLDEQDDTALFVLGNTLFAVYHELGHALIDLLDLPVIGREEDAADSFAAVMMIPPAPDPVRDELIIAVADGWRLQSQQAGRIAGEGPLWAEHALDEQRYFAVICWLVGSDQDGFFDFAEEAGMPRERMVTCADDFQRMRASWEGLLAHHRVDVNHKDGGLAGRIDVIFDQPHQDDVDALDWARTGEVIERSVLAFGRSIALPEDVAVRFKSCDEANAFWFGDDREVLICYGLVDDFLSVLLGDSGR